MAVFAAMGEFSELRHGLGGLMLTCTCSAAVAAEEATLLGFVREAAKAAGRRVTVLNVMAQAGHCSPARTTAPVA